MKSNLIEHFISKLQRRLNLGNALRIGSWVLGGAGVLLIAHAAFYRYQGESVPWPTTIGLIIVAAVLLVAACLVKLTKPREAALIADRELGLKDSLSSSLSFREADKDGEVYRLQQKTAENLVENREPKEIPLRYSRRWMVAGALMTVIAIGLGFLSPSAAVQERLDREAITEARTEEIRQEIEKAVEEMTRDLSEEEKEVLKPDELKQWVKDLKPTKDQKEALRQLARFEQKVAKAMAGMEARKDEESLKLAAFELSKSDQAAARQLGKRLDKKDFKQAAEDIKKAGDKAKEKASKEDPKKNKFNKEQLKKLREMTKRMADAARKRNAGKMQDPKGKMAKGNPKDNQKGKDMDQMMKDLDAAAADAEMLEDAEMGEMDQDDLDKMEMAEEDFDKQMQRMQARLKKLDAKNKMKKKLAGLRAGLGKAQQYAMGKGGAPSMGNNPGAGQGKGIGVGSNESRRKERDELKKNDQFAELKGQKGTGPSMTAVEDADSGTGISRRTGEAKKREYQRQLESFVRRDDVPEDVKSGVKEYFEKVHQVQETQK